MPLHHNDDLRQDPEELVHHGVCQLPLLVSQLGLGQLHVPGGDDDRLIETRALNLLLALPALIRTHCSGSDLAMLSGLAVEMRVVGRSALARLHSTEMSVMSSPCSEHHLAAFTHADLTIFYKNNI